ncbi:MAG: pyridoxamine 5'-phosphate oxidase family protein [Flavobacteriaceae bacterium]|nr:pyridoxamine 5'-phosphate oxidase family protein [Flavobacteriaceae bacterium]
MDLIKDWKIIKKHISESFKTNLHVSIASVSNKGNPSVRPIGTLFLNDNQTGFYFEKFSSGLFSQNAKGNNKVCVLAVNSSKTFWVKSLFNGSFKKHPALKVYGELGQKRKATKTELYALKRRMRNTKSLKGHKYLWGEMDFVRELTFTDVEVMKLGKMISA